MSRIAHESEHIGASKKGNGDKRDKLPAAASALGVESSLDGVY